MSRSIKWAKAKFVARLLTPPILFNALKASLKLLAHNRERLIELEEPVEYEYVPEGWLAGRHNANIKGWNVNSVLDSYKAKWPAFVEKIKDTSPLDFSPESNKLTEGDLATHNTLISYAYALALASCGKSKISMLDWGGGIGHYYLISQSLLPDLNIDYHCKDVALLAEHGRQLFPQSHFYTDEMCLEKTYSFVLASSSLHYSEDWLATFKALAQATTDYIFVTRLPVIQDSPSYVFVQRPYRYGYNTEYLGWCLNRSELIEHGNKFGLRLIREFIIGERPPIYRAPEQCQYRGFLFRKLNNKGKS